MAHHNLIPKNGVTKLTFELQVLKATIMGILEGHIIAMATSYT